MGPNAACRPHGPSQCLVDLEIRVVMFKRRGDGRENTNHMGEGGRNRLNQWHYSLSCSCLCDTPRMARLNIVLVIMRGGGYGAGHTSLGGKLGPNFSKSRRHALKLNITCSMFRVRVSLSSTPSSSSPSTYLPGLTSTTSFPL